MHVYYLFLLTKPRAQGVRADEISQEPSKDHGSPFRRLEKQRDSSSCQLVHRIEYYLSSEKELARASQVQWKEQVKIHLFYCLLKKNLLHIKILNMYTFSVISCKSQFWAASKLSLTQYIISHKGPTSKIVRLIHYFRPSFNYWVFSVYCSGQGFEIQM